MPSGRTRSEEALFVGRPLILTTFVNKAGAIGLSLLPILLVQRKMDVGTSAWILGSVKSVVIYGTLLAGLLNDRFGARKTLFLGFLGLGIGLTGLPFQSKAGLILGLAAFAQFGDALIRVSTRMLLTATVPRALHKEAFAWLRTVINFGQIFSFGLGALGAKLGVLPLMLFDGGTALLALLVGQRIIPHIPRNAPSAKKKAEAEAAKRDLLRQAHRALAPFYPAIACAITIATWNFYYELFMSGIAARLEILHPGQGLGTFSTMMFLNTVLCALFAIKMASWVSRPSRVFTVGLGFTTVGLVIAVLYASTIPLVGVGVFLVTIGELLLGALAQLLQVRLLPEGRAEGFFYSGMVVVAQSGRLAGAALAFPWIANAPVDAWRMPIVFWAPIAAAFALLVAYGKKFDSAAA